MEGADPSRFIIHTDNERVDARLMANAHDLAFTALDALARCEELKKENLRNISIFKWLLDLGGDFPAFVPGRPYAFRSELRKKLSNETRAVIEGL